MEMEKIVAAILVLAVLVILLFFFTNAFGKGARQTGGMLDRANSDCDGDGQKDLVDPCPWSLNDKKGGKCDTTNCDSLNTEECKKVCKEENK